MRRARLEEVEPHLRSSASPRTTAEATMTATTLAIPCKIASVASSTGPLRSGTRSTMRFLSGRFKTWLIAKTSKDNNRLCILWLTPDSLPLRHLYVALCTLYPDSVVQVCIAPYQLCRYSKRSEGGVDASFTTGLRQCVDHEHKSLRRLLLDRLVNSVGCPETTQPGILFGHDYLIGSLQLPHRQA